MRILSTFAVAAMISLSACDTLEELQKIANLCSGQPNCVFVPKSAEMTIPIQTALQAATNGQTIVLPEGEFKIKGELSLVANAEDIVIRGQGKDKTILDFSEQIDELGLGANGLLVETGTNIVVEGLTIRDPAGDGLVFRASKNVVARDVRVEWTEGFEDDGTFDFEVIQEHGLYGIYPIQCDGVLIEDSIARGASDAGIYVGESKNIIVRNNEVSQSVSGLQIENSINSEVYGNNVHNNTAGLFVFDLPGKQTQQNGGKHRIHNNISKENNGPNFAEKGQIAANVPPGTGVIVMAAKNTEVFGNSIEGNSGAGLVVVSFIVTEREYKHDKIYYPYPATIFVHDNTFVGGGDNPLTGGTTRGPTDIQLVFDEFFGKDVPELIYDGMTTTPVDGAPTDNTLNTQYVCFEGNKAGSAAAAFANMRIDLVDLDDPLGTLDADNVEHDITKFACGGTGVEQPEVKLPDVETLGK